MKKSVKRFFSYLLPSAFVSAVMLAYTLIYRALF